MNNRLRKRNTRSSLEYFLRSRPLQFRNIKTISWGYITNPSGPWKCISMHTLRNVRSCLCCPIINSIYTFNVSCPRSHLLRGEFQAMEVLELSMVTVQLLKKAAGLPISHTPSGSCKNDGRITRMSNCILRLKFAVERFRLAIETNPKKARMERLSALIENSARELLIVNPGGVWTSVHRFYGIYYCRSTASQWELKEWIECV